MRRYTLIALFALLASTAACGDRATAPGPAGGGDDPVFLPPDPDGMPLPGEPGDDAIGAIVSLRPSPVPPEENDQGRLTTRIRAVVDPDATVAQVNQVLEEQDAAIVSMFEGFPTVLLVVDPLATEEESQARADAFAATDAFLMAFPGRTFGTNPAVQPVEGSPDLAGSAGGNVSAAIPTGWVPEEFPHDYMRRLLLVHSWALRPALTDQVPVVLADEFAQPPSHDEIPGLDYADDHSGFYSEDLTRDGSRVIGNRGFHHAGIIGAAWEGSPLVGVHPDAPILGVPIGGLDVEEVIIEIIVELASTPGPQVLVTPWVYSTDPTVPIPLFSAMEAASWKFHLRNLGLENRVLHIASAGDTGQESARYSLSHNMSPWNIAASYSRLVDYLDANLPNEGDREDLLRYEEILGFGEDGLDPGPIDNVIIVGAGNASGDELATSATLPHLIVPGEAIAGPCTEPDPSGSPLCNGEFAAYTGTGPAAAIVGGIASFLWNLYPERSLEDIRDAIMWGYSVNFGFGFIDTFDAALALDRGLFAPKVREAALDVTGSRDDYPNLDEPNGEFDEKDLKVFVDRFAAVAGRAPDLNDLRFDLNGDYSLDPEGRNTFDLDANTPPSRTVLTYEVRGETVEVDESSVTDLEVLCYYAYSDLYLGDETARDVLLAECGDQTGLFVQLTGVPERVSAGETAVVTVTVGFNQEGGGVVVGEGIEVSFDDLDGVEASPDDGITDAAGRFQATITFGDDDNVMTVGVWAETDDEEVYAEKTARRQNEIEIIERRVYADAGVFATYAPVPGSPSIRIFDDYFFHESEDFSSVDTTLAASRSAAVDGMTFSGNAESQVQTTVDVSSGTDFSGLAIDSESEASITLTNPNFQVQSYQTQSYAVVETDVEFIVWGDPARFTLSGSASSEDYEVDLEGPEGDVFECDETDEPCGTINASGDLPPGEYDLSIYHGNGGFIRWFQDCDGCTVSGTQASSGRLNVDFQVSH